MLIFTFPLCLCACRTFLDQEKSGQSLRSRKKRAPRQQYSWGKEIYTVCHHGWWSAIAEWVQTGVCMEAPATNNIWWTKAEDWLWCTGLCVYYTGMISQLKLYTCIKLLLLLLLLLKTKIYYYYLIWMKTNGIYTTVANSPVFSVYCTIYVNPYEKTIWLSLIKLVWFNGSF